MSFVVRKPRLARRPAARVRTLRYQLGGKLPWSVGYADVKQALLRRVLWDDDLLRVFRTDAPLPPRYGLRLDERVVEYPWALSRLAAGPRRLLDAGSTLNQEFLLEHPSLASKRITIVTLAPESISFWHRGVSYDFEDLRALPYRDGLFDDVVCLSTLEHVGMDNSMYGAPPTRSPAPEFAVAASELMRVLRIGGRALLTVPFGLAEDHGFLRQFDSPELEALVDALGRARVAKTFFRYTPDGWTRSEEAACRDCSYFNIHERARDRRDGRPVFDPDYAAAARAVACLEVIRLR